LSSGELGKLRNRIRAITEQIIFLVAERNKLSLDAFNIKKELGLPIEDRETELALEERIVSLCRELNVNERTGLKILHTLMEDSKSLQGFTRGQTVTPMAVAAKARKLAAEGREIIRLDIGEPDFGPPEQVVEECIRAIREGKTKYTDSRGIPPLISALQDYLKLNYKYDANKENILVTPGGRFAIFAALSAIIKEGESVVIIEPCWPAYRENIEFAGGRTISLRTEVSEGWEPDTEALKQSITKTTRAIILSYPSNPTGKIIDREKFRDIVEIAKEKDLIIISDEIYNEYSYRDCPSVLDYGEENFVLTSSFSKTWAMTGFRIGYAVSRKEIIDRMFRVLSLAVTCVPEFIQHAAIKALSSTYEAKKNSETMKKRIDSAYSEIAKIEKLETYKPDGAMYLFPVAKERNFDGDRFSDELLERMGVAISPGTGFGDYKNAFRISLGQSEDRILQGIKKIGEALG
jgi:aspartate aminotransferase